MIRPTGVLYRAIHWETAYIIEMRDTYGSYCSGMAIPNRIPERNDLFFPSGTLDNQDLTVIAGSCFQIAPFPPYRTLKRVHTIPLKYVPMITGVMDSPSTDDALIKRLFTWIGERRRFGW